MKKTRGQLEAEFLAEAKELFDELDLLQKS